jgi:hypothetical protein
MNTLSKGKAFFDATLKLERRPWEGGELHRVLATYPLMTLRVIGAIYWEAVRLWLKDVPVFTHPAKIARAEQSTAGGCAAAESKGSLAG